MKMILILVAYHPPADEVERLQACLATLDSEVGYAVVVNDHQPGEPVDRLQEGAQLFLTSSHNHGYGRAFNRALAALLALPERRPQWIGALNTDLTWLPGTFERLLAWLQDQSNVVLAVPQITDEHGEPACLCKRDPTLLALASRRFWPERLKPTWVRRYDRWYTMQDQDQDLVLDVPYLSGCCMLMSTESFSKIKGFDERFFMYLEDADLTRPSSAASDVYKRQVPFASVQHRWARGSHRSFRLTWVTLQSAWLYFGIWGLRFW